MGPIVPFVFLFSMTLFFYHCSNRHLDYVPGIHAAVHVRYQNSGHGSITENFHSDQVSQMYKAWFAFRNLAGFHPCSPTWYSGFQKMRAPQQEVWATCCFPWALEELPSLRFWWLPLAVKFLVERTPSSGTSLVSQSLVQLTEPWRHDHVCLFLSWGTL